MSFGERQKHKCQPELGKTQDKKIVHVVCHFSSCIYHRARTVGVFCCCFCILCTPMQYDLICPDSVLGRQFGSLVMCKKANWHSARVSLILISFTVMVLLVHLPCCHCKYIVPHPYAATCFFIPVSPISPFDIVYVSCCLLCSYSLIPLSYLCSLFLFLAMSPFLHSFQKGVQLILT